MFELINKKTYKLLFIIAALLSLVVTLSVVSKSVGVHLINDKLGHALMFFFLAFLCSHSLGSKFGYKAIIGLAVFGLVIEIIQYFLPWRSFSVFDWLADLVGIISYDVIHRMKRRYLLKKLLKKSYRQPDQSKGEEKENV
ncbi:MAG: hypothetical protein COA74_05695 [Gammaproteobacteria bacterium]|nr:MAG: hypothetical protein COA74_05695 [Gammaproteobacteria bacterium]